MPTIYSGRPPTSFTKSAYDAHITYDQQMRYDGLTILDTQWNGRLDRSAYLWSAIIQPWRSDIQPWLLTGPTIFTGRTPI